MANYSDTMDAMFGALADPTRRAVVRRLGRGPATVSELASHFPLTLPTFLKHVRVLEASGLVRTRKTGRVRTCTLDRDRLGALDDWLDEQRRVWEDRTDRLEAFVTTPAAPAAHDRRTP